MVYSWILQEKGFLGCDINHTIGWQ